ncbi:MAG TPA: glycerol-3-phosphate 1-O-acyltransferase PlsY [Clostridia bacterium]|nr:glycerol-3-phosphate 1-O-acyltransferase PlsY [Clostridia bacterium]
MNIIVSIIVGYFLGGLPFAYVIGKIQKNIDLRKVGSGNLGATNVFRNLGSVSFAICAFFDIGKAFLAFHIGLALFGQPYGFVAGMASVIGHCYSPFLKFKGGKGVAASGGLLLAYDWRIFIVALFLMIIILFISRRMSLASIGAALSTPLIYYLFYGFDLLIFGAIILAGFLVFQHRDNITRLLNGTEAKLF